MSVALGIDAEATAQSVTSWAPAVGITLLAHDGTILFKKGWRISPSVIDTTVHVSGPSLGAEGAGVLPHLCPYFDSRTFSRFWARHIDVFLEFQEQLTEPGEAWVEIDNLLQHMYKQYPNLVIVSDNPGFDVNLFNRNLYHFANNQLGIRFAANGARHIPLINPVDCLRTCRKAHAARICAAATSDQPHDHRPENDAHYTARQYTLLPLKQQTIRSV